MNSLLHGSIRKKLAIIFVCSALPAIVAILLTGLNNRQKAITQAEKELLHFSQAANLHVDKIPHLAGFFF